MPRYIREGDERIAAAIARVGRRAVEANRPTGTERARTKETAAQAALDSEFAKQLAEQLEAELGPLPGQIQEALDDAAAALTEAGLSRSEAADAVAAAQAAASEAADAITAAQAAAQAAADAQTAADGKSTVVRSTSPATGAGSYKQGDQWWQFSGANIVGLWLHDGAAWVSQALTNAIIATLDAGKITTGTLAADRIGALSITAAKIAAEAITTEKIAALAVTASELAANSVVATKIAANAVVAEKISAGAVTTIKLDALAVTAEKIAAGAIIADKIAANAVTANKIAATAIDGMVITGPTIRTAGSGQRMQLDTGGLRAFDALGQVTATMRSDGLGITADGPVTAPFSNGGRVRLNPYGPTVGISLSGRHTTFASDSEIALNTFNADSATKGQIMVRGGTRGRFSVTLEDQNPGVVKPKVTLSDSGSPDGVETDLDISMNTRFSKSVTFLGDTAWGKIDTLGIATLGSGFAHDTDPYYGGLWARIKGGVLYITGRLIRASFAGNAVLFTLNSAYRPGKPVVQYAYTGGANFAVAEPGGNCIIALAGAGGATLGFSWPL